MVGSDICRARGNGYRTRKAYLLPAAGGLGAESRSAQQRSRRSPEMRDVCTRIQRTLVEPEAGYRPVDRGAEFDSNLDGTRVTRIDHTRRVGGGEQALSGNRVIDIEETWPVPLASLVSVMV